MIVYSSLFILMIRSQPHTIRTDNIFPTTTLFRSTVPPVRSSGGGHPPRINPIFSRFGPHATCKGCAVLANEASLACPRAALCADPWDRSEEHTSELQSLLRISYAVFCLTKKRQNTTCHIFIYIFSLLNTTRT